MATIPHSAAPLDMLLSALPSLPRPLLARLTTRLIDRLDEIDGDPDASDTSWNERPSQAKWPRDRLLLASEDAELDDFGEDEGDREGIDEREAEMYIDGQPDIRPSSRHRQVFAPRLGAFEPRGGNQVSASELSSSGITCRLRGCSNTHR